MGKDVEGSGSRVIQVRQTNCHGICLEGVRENIVRDLRNTKQACQPLRRDCRVTRIVVSGCPVLYVWQFATRCAELQVRALRPLV